MRYIHRYRLFVLCQRVARVHGQIDRLMIVAWNHPYGQWRHIGALDRALASDMCMPADDTAQLLHREQPLAQRHIAESALPVPPRRSPGL